MGSMGRDRSDDAVEEASRVRGKQAPQERRGRQRRQLAADGLGRRDDLRGRRRNAGRRLDAQHLAGDALGEGMGGLLDCLDSFEELPGGLVTAASQEETSRAQHRGRGVAVVLEELGERAGGCFSSWPGRDDRPEVEPEAKLIGQGVQELGSASAAQDVPGELLGSTARTVGEEHAGTGGEG